MDWTEFYQNAQAVSACVGVSVIVSLVFFLDRCMSVHRYYEYSVGLHLLRPLISNVLGTFPIIFVSMKFVLTSVHDIHFCGSLALTSY